MNILYMLFDTARDLTRFTNDPANSVSTIISITFDNSGGKYTLFYVSA